MGVLVSVHARNKTKSSDRHGEREFMMAMVLGNGRSKTEKSFEERSGLCFKELTAKDRSRCMTSQMVEGRSSEGQECSCFRQTR